MAVTAVPRRHYWPGAEETLMPCKEAFGSRTGRSFSSCFIQFVQEFFNWLNVFDVFCVIQFLRFTVHISESVWFGLPFMWNHGILFSSGSASAAGPVGNPCECILIWTLDGLADTSVPSPKMSTSYSSTWCTQIFIVRNEVTQKKLSWLIQEEIVADLQSLLVDLGPHVGSLGDPIQGDFWRLRWFIQVKTRSLLSNGNTVDCSISMV